MLFFSKYNHLLTGLPLLFSISGVVLGAADASPDTTENSQHQWLVESLQAGGFIVYFRHAETNRSQVDQDRNDLSDCATQRNLSEAGRAQARAIGEAIQTLNIPIGKVITSPYCRCQDTAQLAFGKSEVSVDLRFGLGDNRQQTAHLSQALKAMLSKLPANGTNTVLVSHSANLKETAGIWPEPEGAAYIFKPLPGRNFEYLGRFPPDAWVRQASKPSVSSAFLK